MVMYEVVVLFHVLAVIVAVGAVSVTDYLHLVGLRRKKLEKQLKDVYPNVSRMIHFALMVIILTGILLVMQKPSLLESTHFILKMCLVVVVTVNGIFLQKVIAPNLDLCVLKGTKYCSQNLLYTSAISGSLSVVSWYAIVVLAFTKSLGYTPLQFIFVYAIVLVIAILTAVYFERKARRWRNT